MGNAVSAFKAQIANSNATAKMYVIQQAMLALSGLNEESPRDFMNGNMMGSLSRDAMRT